MNFIKCKNCETELNHKNFQKKNLKFFKNCEDCRIKLNKSKKEMEHCKLCDKYIYNIKFHIQSKSHYIKTLSKLQQVIYTVGTVPMLSPMLPNR
jgi:hypothetical protein